MTRNNRGQEEGAFDDLKVDEKAEVIFQEKDGEKAPLRITYPRCIT